MAYRRMGSVIWASTRFIPFDQIGNKGERWYQFENSLNGLQTRVLINGTADAAWTAVVCSLCAPPTATSLYFQINNINANATMYLRKRNTGDTDLTRNLADLKQTRSMIWCMCDLAQVIDYVTAGGSDMDLIVDGYQESLL